MGSRLATADLSTTNQPTGQQPRFTNQPTNQLTNFDSGAENINNHPL